MSTKPTLKQILEAKGFSPQDAETSVKLASFAVAAPQITKNGLTFKIITDDLDTNNTTDESSETKGSH